MHEELPKKLRLALCGKDPNKYDRLYQEDEGANENDFRSPGQRDYDRVLYASGFMRLGGVSQVAHAEDTTVVHNRLTHSLKVSSLGRGLAWRLVKLSPELATQAGGLDPDIVAACGLAHDLGHPPFGHVAERVLQDLVKEETKNPDGFEGNAQSFRVVTKTSIRRMTSSECGLNLCRGTLCALLKYPWLCDEEDEAPVEKWGAYETEREEFEWARKGKAERQRSLEAEIMDFADDVAYATHDIEDYYRAGLIPLDRLMNDKTERERFVKKAQKRIGNPPVDIANRLDVLLGHWAAVAQVLRVPYSGLRAQRGAARTFSSHLITHFFEGIALSRKPEEDGAYVTIEPSIRMELDLLKLLTREYVLPHHGLAAEEHGQQEMIRYLFRIFWESVQDDQSPRLLPPRYAEQVDEVRRTHQHGNKASLLRARIVVDIIAEMTETQATRMYLRLKGFSSRSLLDSASR